MESPNTKNDEIICYCKNIGKLKIVNAIDNGAKTLRDIQDMTLACTGNNCKETHPKKRCCSVEIMELLKEKGNDSANVNCSCCQN
ncbi:NAD(P)H-nitrite reductase [Candidatus Woesearchaeota archaeon]|nr:NAD(P)H-nitrite reductase [Candidatus Woesearchaeota archaeon]